MADVRRGYFGWIGGASIILLGIAFLWRNQGPVPQPDPAKWWAWMLLLPAVMMLSISWRHWKANGRVGGALLAALMTIWLAAIFLLGLPFSGSWPLMFVFLGIYLILRNFGR